MKTDEEKTLSSLGWFVILLVLGFYAWLAVH